VVLSENQWHLGSLVEKKDAAVYQIQSTVRELGGHEYRFIIVHSSALDKRKEKSINKKISTSLFQVLSLMLPSVPQRWGYFRWW
jgi:hypothetical protein